MDIFDQQNPVVKLCAAGMEEEGAGNGEAAAALFMNAWRSASSDIEKFTAAHYVARHQKTVEDKLKWDETALHHALQAKNEQVKSMLPSLYLNIGKCCEDLGEREKAHANYSLAHTYAAALPAGGYGNMIRSGIENGLERTSLV